MTSYNREKYIAEAIESVLNSSFKNFELIIVDDCSTDNTVSIIKKYTSDPHVKLYVNESNLGQFGNRNKAASYANGKYIKYADSDDIIYRYAFSIMVDAMEKFPEAGVGVFSWKHLDDRPYPFILTQKEALEAYYFKGDILSIGPIGSIFRTDVFRELNGFTNLTVAGDTEFMLTVALKYPVVIVGTYQFWWRQHEGQAFKEQGVTTVYVIQQYLINKKIISDPAFPLAGKEQRKLLRGTQRLLVRNIFKQYVLKGKLAQARKILEATKVSYFKLLSYFF